MPAGPNNSRRLNLVGQALAARSMHALMAPSRAMSRMQAAATSAGLAHGSDTARITMRRTASIDLRKFGDLQAADKVRLEFGRLLQFQRTLVADQRGIVAPACVLRIAEIVVRFRVIGPQ